MKIETYMKGGLWASVALGGAALGLGHLPFAMICLGAAFASVGEWMHYRKRFDVVPATMNTPGGVKHQYIRVRHKPGDALIAIGFLFGVVGLAGVIRTMFFQ
ncbi:hypothetical protein GN330_16620 [Nitratireductor sp. CAU 1489]|uniref:Transmembrane protein n=1 Tax=Nitratireductor arenosus TaxID=2682096 RepID=A0A844QLI3_9HYPH|nr:hypothetical protein [Nitratireductor arenosus]MVA98873.1 hypothetical protein [Nitratireductor arenosus]